MESSPFFPDLKELFKMQTKSFKVGDRVRLPIVGKSGAVIDRPNVVESVALYVSDPGTTYAQFDDGEVGAPPTDALRKESEQGAAP